jgi:hypothetical protein
LDGVSLFDALQDIPRPDDKPILFEIWSHLLPNPAIGMVFTANNGKNYMFTFNSVDDLDELYELNREKTLRNVIREKRMADVLQEAVSLMDTILERDARWVSYSNVFKLTYAENIGKPSGDRQFFF